MGFEIIDAFALMGTIILVGFSTSFSLFMTYNFIKFMSNEDLLEEEEKERGMIEFYDNLLVETKFIDEFNSLLPNPDLVLSDLKETHMEFPHLNVKVIMYYDEGFYYYSTTDLVHKYLNTVCRKFVIENNAKQLYQESFCETIEPSVSSNLFITKQESIVQEKKINNFIRKGSINDYESLKNKNKKEIKPIDITDFLKMRNI
uniref:Uncharacterized protein n=1 Tax=viral metagenome TaxID=1070528 RepID=A0A6C0ESX8_9ZZZZ